MKRTRNAGSASGTRPHYPLLDGWRGVAALVEPYMFGRMGCTSFYV